MTKSSPLEFLKAAQEDPKLSARVLEAVEKGGMVTAEAVLKLAEEAGFTFTRYEFEEAVRRNIAERFAAGEEHLAGMVNAKDPPESSCASGCLSYTTSWHP